MFIIHGFVPCGFSKLSLAFSRRSRTRRPFHVYSRQPREGARSDPTAPAQDTRSLEERHRSSQLFPSIGGVGISSESSEKTEHESENAYGQPALKCTS